MSNQDAEQKKCNIHGKVEPAFEEDIRRDLCSKAGSLIQHTNGKYYCIFHLPTDDKNSFAQSFRDRLNEVNKMAATDKSYHNFRYVWFPATFDFKNCQFSADVSFRSATFSGEVDFSTSTFEADASFRSTKFLAKANFRKTTFKADVSFSSASFSKGADFYKATFETAVSFSSATFLKGSRAEFRKATFKAEAVFESATFEAEAFFGQTTFSGDVRFHKVKFYGDTETFFNDANFAKNTYFDDAEFKNDVSFNSAIFGNDSDVFFLRSSFGGNADFQYCAVEGYLRFNDLQWEEKPRFNFQGALVEKASRISFESMQLYPNWFVNVDARKFVFVEINWQNYTSPREWKKRSTWMEKKNKNIYDELSDIENRETRERNKRLYEIVMRDGARSNANKNAVDAASRKYQFEDYEWKKLSDYLRGRGYKKELEQITKCEPEKQKKHLLRILGIAVRQLADNAEVNNRYEEASRFRYMAMEANLLEYGWLRRRFTLSWWYRLLSFYGERWLRAFCMLFGVLVLFGLIYACPLLSTFDYGEKKEMTFGLDAVERQIYETADSVKEFHQMTVAEGFVHSLSVAAFQRPEPKPGDFLTKLMIALNAMFAPLQAALLALAIRRKFMR